MNLSPCLSYCDMDIVAHQPHCTQRAEGVLALEVMVTPQLTLPEFHSLAAFLRSLGTWESTGQWGELPSLVLPWSCTGCRVLLFTDCPDGQTPGSFFTVSSKCS